MKGEQHLTGVHAPRLYFRAPQLGLVLVRCNVSFYKWYHSDYWEEEEEGEEKEKRKNLFFGTLLLRPRLLGRSWSWSRRGRWWPEKKFGEHFSAKKNVHSSIIFPNDQILYQINFIGLTCLMRRRIGFWWPGTHFGWKQGKYKGRSQRHIINFGFPWGKSCLVFVNWYFAGMMYFSLLSFQTPKLWYPTMPESSE